MTDPSQPLFLFGPGYSATVLASIWPGPVYGTLRSPERRSSLLAANITPVAFDQQADIAQAVSGAHLVVSAPPDATGCPALRSLGDAAKSAASITYLSTTGVYGDLQGGWAMDWSPRNATSERARRRVQAECAWQAVRSDTRFVRLPGIYGPGRSVFERIETARARRIVKIGQVFSRIHVDDLAAGVKALILAEAAGAYNLCDEEAAPPQDVVTYACALQERSPPPEIAYDAAELSPMARSFYSECKRVSNARIKAATGWRPRFPTYREGLQDIYAAKPSEPYV